MFQRFVHILVMLLLPLTTCTTMADRNKVLIMPVGPPPPLDVVMIVIDDLDVASLNVLLQQGKLPNIQTHLVEPGITFPNAYVVDAYSDSSRASILTGQYPHNTGLGWADIANNAFKTFHGPDYNGLDRLTVATFMQSQGYTKTLFMGKYTSGYGAVGAKGVPLGWDTWYGMGLSSVVNNTTAPGQYVYYTNLPAPSDVVQPDQHQLTHMSHTAVDYIKSADTTSSSLFMLLEPLAVHIEVPATDVYENTTAADTSYYSWRISVDLLDGKGYSADDYSAYGCVNNSPYGCFRQRDAQNVVLDEVPLAPVYGLPNAGSSASVEYTSDANLCGARYKKDKPAAICYGTHPDAPVPAQPFKAIVDGTLNHLQRQHLDRLETLITVDVMVGSLIEQLRASGRLDHSLIIFTSDNGVVIGEHRLMQKQQAYQESTHIPLIIRPPFSEGVTSARSNPALVLNIDLFPTIAAYVAPTTYPVYAQMYALDGRSLKPFLDNPERVPTPNNWRSWFLITHTEQTADDDGNGLPNNYFYPPYQAIQTAPFSDTSYPWGNQLYVEYETEQFNNLVIDQVGSYVDLHHEHYDMRYDSLQITNTLTLIDGRTLNGRNQGFYRPTWAFMDSLIDRMYGCSFSTSPCQIADDLVPNQLFIPLVQR